MIRNDDKKVQCFTKGPDGKPNKTFTFVHPINKRPSPLVDDIDRDAPWEVQQSCFEENLFSSLEEAEAECDRRNKLRKEKA